MSKMKFAKGDKIKCINAKHANPTGGLTEGEVYTAREDSYITVGWQEAVALEEIPGWAFQVDRFERVSLQWTAETPKIVEDPAVSDVVGPNVAGIVIGPEGIQMNEILIPADPANDEIKPGSWVYVRGQVLESMEGDDMDYKVEFFSHNEQWPGWVRKDRVIQTMTPDFVGQCTAMTVNVLDTNVYYRCEKPEHRRFDKNHKSGAYEWLEGDTSGYVEEA